MSLCYVSRHLTSVRLIRNCSVMIGRSSGEMKVALNKNQVKLNGKYEFKVSENPLVLLADNRSKKACFNIFSYFFVRKPLMKSRLRPQWMPLHLLPLAVSRVKAKMKRKVRSQPRRRQLLLQPPLQHPASRHQVGRRSTQWFRT